ncbi:unnamed protein product, partial [Phaeothamnion confervicola]
IVLKKDGATYVDKKSNALAIEGKALRSLRGASNATLLYHTKNGADFLKSEVNKCGSWR